MPSVSLRQGNCSTIEDASSALIVEAGLKKREKDIILLVCTRDTTVRKCNLTVIVYEMITVFGIIRVF